MKIAVLSAFHPLRGGVAQFNANLVEELGREHRVRAFNFSRQYPDFLFPGKTQYVGKDDTARGVEAEAVLDTANPCNWPKAARCIREWGPDVLLLRYWMPYFAPSLGTVSRKMAPGCKVVAIADNILPHEPHWFDKPLTRYFLAGLDGCVTLCDEVGRDVAALRKNLPCCTLSHPAFSQFGEKRDRAEALATLGIPEGGRKLLFFGLIRAYKGLDILLRAFDSLPEEYHLIIAGEPYGPFDEYQALIDANRGKGRIHLFPHYIPDGQVRDFFSCADLVVLPYRSATQSGVGATCCQFGVPLVVTDTGGLRHTVGEKGIGLVVDKPEPEDICAGILRFFGEPGLRERCLQALAQEKEQLSWKGFCNRLTAFVESL
ncbi:MAG: glycosyltransferase [Bacteroidales bacterium]|nr:glycosyltransferase [Bacteroidales bacterium]